MGGGGGIFETVRRACYDNAALLLVSLLCLFPGVILIYFQLPYLSVLQLVVLTGFVKTAHVSVMLVT